MSSSSNNFSLKAHTSLLRGTSVVAILTLVSRLFGFIREIQTAHLFGAGSIADAYFVAYRIPNLLRSFVAEGAMTSAFVPVFATELEKGGSAARETLRAACSLVLSLTVVLTVLGVIFAPALTLLFAPGFDPGSDKFSLCIVLMQIMFPFIVCISLVALLSAALNSVHIFGSAAFAQIVINVVLILGAVTARYFQAHAAAEILSVSVVIGGIAGIITQIPALRRCGFSVMPSRAIITPATKQMMKLMLPALVGASIYQLTIFFNTVLASLLENGSVSWLYYADRVTQLPVGVFSLALGSVLLPTLARSSAQGDPEAFNRNLVNALRFTSFCIIPVAASVAYLALPLVQLMFENGKFTHYSSIQTSRAVIALSLGLWGVSCQSLAARAFIARKDTITPTLAGLFSLFLNLTLSLIFMGTPRSTDGGGLSRWLLELQNWLRDHTGHIGIGHPGLSLASSTASTFSFFLLVILLSRGLRRSTWDPFVRATWQSLASALLTIFILEALQIRAFRPLISVSIGLLLGATLYLVIAKLLGSSELQETFATFSRLLKRVAR